MTFPDIAQSAGWTFRRNLLRLRPIEPEHAADFVRLVDACSPDNRFLRFHTGVYTLRPAMARKLVTMEPGSGEAWGLWNWRGHLVAEARYTRLTDDVAETAILVADKYHGRGLGQALLAVVFTHAADAGYAALHAEVLSGNDTILHVLDKLVPENSVSYEQGVRHVCLPLSEQPCPACAAVREGPDRMRGQTVVTPPVHAVAVGPVTIRGRERRDFDGDATIAEDG